MDKPKSFMTPYMIPLAILLPMLLKNAAAQQMSPNEFNVGKWLILSITKNGFDKSWYIYNNLGLSMQ